MENNINIKELWLSQVVENSSADNLILKANSLKKLMVKKLLISNLILISTSVLIALVWYYYQPQFLSTKIGIVFCFVAMLMYLTVYNTIIPFLKQVTNVNDSKSHLAHLLRIKEKELFRQTTLLNIYFIVLTLGLCLYMYEYTSRMTVTWAIICYVIVLLWISINAFYLNPKRTKPQQKKIQKLIDSLKNIQDQLNDKF